MYYNGYLFTYIIEKLIIIFNISFIDEISINPNN